MSFCLNELAYHLEIQDKLHEEIVMVLNRHKELNYDALQELQYMEAVIEGTKKTKMEKMLKVFIVFG